MMTMNMTMTMTVSNGGKTFWSIHRMAISSNLQIKHYLLKGQSPTIIIIFCIFVINFAKNFIRGNQEIRSIFSKTIQFALCRYRSIEKVRGRRRWRNRFTIKMKNPDSRVSQLLLVLLFYFASFAEGIKYRDLGQWSW